GGAGSARATGQSPARATDQSPALSTAPGGPASQLLQALTANPLTAPYRFAVTVRDGRYVLSGRVGTKQVHDAAIQTAGALGIAVRDAGVIDTAEAHRAAAPRAAGLAPGATTGTPAYYVSPQPLMGRLDEPFFGFEPPLVSYPPWWGAIAPRE